MLGGIAKIYIAKSSDIKTTGFSVNGTRKGFALKYGVDWTEITSMRDSISDVGKVSEYNEFEIQASTFGLNQLLNRFIGKRIVCKYITPEGEQRIIGINQNAYITKSFDSGTKPGDSLGDLIKIIGLSKYISEVLKPFETPIPPVELPLVKLHYRGDDTYTAQNLLYINDKSGNGYTGYGSANVVDNALNFKKAIDFNNTNSIYIDSNFFGKTALWGGNPNILGYKDEFTFLCVLKFKPTTEYYNNFFSKYSGLIFMHSNYNNSFLIALADGGQLTPFNFTYDNNFHIWTFRCRVNNKLNINVDGNFVEEIEVGEQLQYSIQSHIGASPDKSFTQMAELKIWDVVLTDEELNVEISNLKNYYNL